MHAKVLEDFGLQGIGNVDQVLPITLAIQALQNIPKSEKEKQNF